MELRSIRTIILISIALIVTSEVISWIYGLMGGIGGLIGAILMAAVFIYCGRMAKTSMQSNRWILIPTIIFTVIPVTVKLLSFFSETETSTLKLMWQYGPYFFRFVVPIALLLMAYVSLGKHLEKRSGTS